MIGTRDLTERKAGWATVSCVMGPVFKILSITSNLKETKVGPTDDDAPYTSSSSGSSPAIKVTTIKLIQTHNAPIKSSDLSFFGVGSLAAPKMMQ